MREYQNYSMEFAKNEKDKSKGEPAKAPSTGIPMPPIGNFPVGPDIPSVPLPPPEENFPVYPGEPGIPVPPIGNFPVGPNIPSVPLPPPEENYPVYPGPTPGVPVIPLPNPGEGKPIPPGQGSVIIPVGYAQARFLHAAVNYGPVIVTIGSKQFSDNLAYGSVSPYGRVQDGFRTVTVVSLRSPRVVLLKKNIPFVAGTKVTLAIINSASGLDLLQISDEGCNNRLCNMGCFRVVNLSYNSAPLDVLLSNGTVVFSDVRFKEVTRFKQARAGEYNFYITETPRRYRAVPLETELIEQPAKADRFVFGQEDAEYILSFYLEMQAGVLYTAYIIGNDGFNPSLQVMLIENR